MSGTEASREARETVSLLIGFLVVSIIVSAAVPIVIYILGKDTRCQIQPSELNFQIQRGQVFSLGLLIFTLLSGWSGLYFFPRSGIKSQGLWLLFPVVMLFGSGLAWVLKEVVGFFNLFPSFQSRPMNNNRRVNPCCGFRNNFNDGHNVGMPSGHVTTVAAGVSFLGILLVIFLWKENVRLTKEQKIIITGLIILWVLGIPVLMGLARKAAECHTQPQVIAGGILGGFFGAVFAVLAFFGWFKK